MGEREAEMKISESELRSDATIVQSDLLLFGWLEVSMDGWLVGW